MKILFLALALWLQAAWPAIAGPAEWPMYRHDRTMTCRSEGRGGLTAPAIAWRYDLRAWEVWVAVSAHHGAGHTLEMGPFDGPRELDHSDKRAWGIGRPLVDLAGDGKPVPAAPYAAKILADTPGYQTFDTVMEDNEKGWCVLHAYDTGQQREAWRSERFQVYQAPHPVVVDANADGQLDVVACPHYQIVAMDGRTGKTIEQLRWHEGRNYGHFIAKDIDADSVPEFLVLADFYTHIDLIDNDGKTLKLLWRKEIELKIENKHKILRPRWDSLQDLDGDGRFEVITNLYNDTGNKKWHLMVYDALTGSTALDLPGAFMEGLADVDGDGRVELFCSTTQALYTPASSRLRILNLHNGKAVEKWSHPRGAWVLGANRYPLYINSTVAHADENVIVTDCAGGRKAFYISEPSSERGGEPRLRQFTIAASGKVQPGWVLTGPPGARGLRVVGSHTAPGASAETLVAFGTPTSDKTGITVDGGSARLVSCTGTRPERSQWGNLIAADLDGRGSLSIVAVAANRQVVALSPPSVKTAAPKIRWRRLGAGTLCAADFSGDGVKEVAMLSWNAAGQGVAVTVDGRGRAMWTAPIHGFPGPLEPWNFGTLTALAAGSLTGGEHDDLIVFARRSTMHSDEGHAFRGANGHPLWSRTESFDGERTTWGFGGTPVALYDSNGDGCEDVISLYPVNLTVVSGKDGRQLLGRSAAGNSIFPGVWAAYAAPAIFDFEGDGEPEIIWSGGYCLGVTNLEGDTRWVKTPAADGFPIDPDGNHRWKVVSALDKTLRWMDPANGEILCSLALPDAGRAMAIADLDGDGSEEVVTACGKALLAAGARQLQPSVIWQIEAPAPILEFILADSDADGELEAVLYCKDGWLYGVDRS